MTLLIILGVTETLCFRLVLDMKTGREIHDSSRLKFFKKFLENNFAVSDAENNTSRLLNRGGIADLTLLRTLLAVCQKSWEPSFWEVMDSFVLLAYASLAASRTHFYVQCGTETLGIFICWWSLVVTSKFSLLTIRWYSATRKHLFLCPQNDRSGLRKPKSISINKNHSYHQCSSP